MPYVFFSWTLLKYSNNGRNLPLLKLENGFLQHPFHIKSIHAESTYPGISANASSLWKAATKNDHKSVIASRRDRVNASQYSRIC